MGPSGGTNIGNTTQHRSTAGRVVHARCAGERFGNAGRRNRQVQYQ